jgi:protein-disulfide isomerase
MFKMEDKVNSDGNKKLNINIWLITTIILSVSILILLVMTFKGETTGMSSKAISADEAGKSLVQYLNQKTNGGVELVSSSDKGYLYEVKVKYQNQEIPVYTTKDGKYFIQGATPITDEPVMQKDVANSNTNAPSEVTKSDKPIVEAFVFSYCPYGLQFEKALFPAYDLLKDKADFKIVAIGAMHGEFEKTESLRQISIENIYGKDKLFSYLKEFDKNSDVGSCRGDESCLNNYLPTIYAKLGIDKTKVDNYMKTDAEKIYNEQNARANSLGVGGSPTFVINGAQVQVSRDSNSIKEAVCNAFNTKPNECSQSLSTQSASAGFG